MGGEVRSKALQVAGLPPSPREAHVMVALDDHRILLLGGGSISPVFGPQQFNDTYLLDLQESKWSHMACKGDQPSPRTGISAVVLGDDRLLIFGGSSMTDGYMNDVYVLDTKVWMWSRPTVKGEPPSPRDKHTACLVGRELYVFGGFGPSLASENGGASEANDENDDDEQADVSEMSQDNEDEDGSEGEEDNNPSISFTWFNDLHVLDVVTMAWTKIETQGLMPSPRAAHVAFMAMVTEQNSCEKKHKMIVFGGRDPTGRQNDMFSLDVQALVWRKEGVKAPPARSFHAMVPLSGSQLAACFGGVGANGELFLGLELFDFEAMEWTSLKSCIGAWPPLRGATAMVASLNKEEPKLIIFGGSCSIDDQETVYYNDTYVMDVSSLLNTAH